MTAVFAKTTVSESYPAIGGGAVYDADAFAATVDTGHPAGGSVTKADADVTVSSADQLDDGVSAGTTIWIEAGEYDIGSRRWAFDQDGVTIASDRGVDGSDGALLYTDDRVSNQFEINGDDCRVTGIRFRGPEADSFGEDGYPVSEALTINGDRTEIDNCSLRGYTHAAIEAGLSSVAESVHVHHCDVVDNNSQGLGYGIVAYRADPLIRACYFDNNRHSVAGGGGPDSGWTTRDCIGGPHDRLHAWDMHADGSGNAGTRMTIERCVLLNTHNWYSTSGPSDYRQEAAWIRGTPRDAFAVRYTAWAGTKPTEPMRDSDNDAFNVRHASTFSEGKVEGVDLNVYEWADGDALSEGMGPTRETAVTGYDSGGARGGTNDDGTDSTDEKTGPPPSDSDTMDNPTAGRDGETYQVIIHGPPTGDQAAYVLVAAGGLEEADGSLEDNDRLDGRGLLGRVSTMTDTLRATGPIEFFASVRGPSDIALEIDGTKYPPAAFDASGSTSDGPAGQLALGTMDVRGTTYDAALAFLEQQE